jgi:cell division protein FtsQ
MAVLRSRRRRLAWEVGGALAAVAVVAIALWSPLLKVHNVDVDGAAHTSAAEVARAAGLSDEDNLLFVSTSEVAKRAEELPWVKSARVDRLLPNTVRVRIEEREPAMLLATETGRWVVDESGRVLARDTGIKRLPIMGASGLGPIEPGATIDRLAVTAALRAFGSMPASLSRQIKEGFAPTSERVSFMLESGTVIRYGNARELADKNVVISALLERFKREERVVSYIDVRVPASPAVSGPAPAEPVLD